MNPCTRCGGRRTHGYGDTCRDCHEVIRDGRAMEILALRARGWSWGRIAYGMGVHYPTLKRWVAEWERVDAA